MAKTSGSNFRVEGLEKVLDKLKRVQPEAIKEMRKEIRGVIKSSGVVSSIKSRVPSAAPMSGMNNNGPTRWGGIKSVTSSIIRRTVSGRKTVPLITISVTGGTDALGFDYAELAGIRRKPPRARSKIKGTSIRGSEAGDGSIAVNGQGDNMIKVLEDRFGKDPGRFAFKATIFKRSQIMRESQKVLDKYAESVNKKLR